MNNLNTKLIILILGTIILAACGSGEAEVKESISTEETMDYLDRLTQTHTKMDEVETEEEYQDTADWIGNNAIDVRRELKKGYAKELHAVDDLVKLSEHYEGMAEEMKEDNQPFVLAHAEDAGNQIGHIAREYLDGELPKEYGESIGVSNLYD